MKPIRELRVDHIKSKDIEDRNAYLHVTDLFACPIGVWQQKTGRATPEFNDAKMRRFDAGHNIEERVVEAAQHAGILVSEQDQWRWPEFNMVGSSDLIVFDPDEDQHWLVEVKSIHTYGIDYLYRDNKPHEHYVDQVLLYLDKAKEMYPGIKGKLYYEALDGRTAEFIIEPNPERVAELLKQAQTLHNCIEQDIRPEPLPDLIQENGKWVVNWKVKYCIENGMHLNCVDNPLDPDPKKWNNKLTYQATKKNKQ